MKKKSKYLYKLQKNMIPILEGIKNPKLLELGVRHGVSTNLFLDYCEKNDGKLYSVDIDDCSKVSNSKKWKFIHTRDDNYKKIIEESEDKFDIIYIDSFHNAKHVEKIIYLYFPNLKVNGSMFIDDISWVLYSRNNERDHFNSEVNNYETFLKTLDILNTNMDVIELSFDFTSSGLCKIYKLSNEQLNKSKKIKSRYISIKNLIRKIVYR